MALRVESVAMLVASLVFFSFLGSIAAQSPVPFCPCTTARRLHNLKVRIYCPTGGSSGGTCNSCPIQSQPSFVSDTNSSDVVSVQGFVQVYLEPVRLWVFVSSVGWDRPDLEVVCGQLGYPDSFGSPSKEKLLGCDPYQSCAPPSFLQQLRSVTGEGMRCTGTENTLGKCRNCGWNLCNDRRDSPGSVATVACGYSKKFNGQPESPTYPLRLRGGPVPWEGRVEVLKNRQWGNVCPDPRNFGLLTSLGNVICRSLGYGSLKQELPSVYLGWGFGKVWFEGISCGGFEKTIADCRLGRTHGQSYPCLGHTRDVGLSCNAPARDSCASTVQLVLDPFGNPHYPDHFLEVEVNGERGLVCYGYHDATELAATCRGLLNLHPDRVEPGSASFYRSNTRFVGQLVCPSIETPVEECNKVFVKTDYCPEREKIVHCTRYAADLIVDVDALERSMRYDAPWLERRSLWDLLCEADEKCISAKGIAIVANRENNYNAMNSFHSLLRFTTFAFNIGNSDFRPALAPSDWLYHRCHNHYHSVEAFARYDLLELDGTTRVAEGHKASFCLEDSLCRRGPRRYACSQEQGISSGCGDRYSFATSCNWIDVTEVPLGRDYLLQITTNPARQVYESDFENNQAVCRITLDVLGYVRVKKCVTPGYASII